MYRLEPGPSRRAARSGAIGNVVPVYPPPPTRMRTRVSPWMARSMVRTGAQGRLESALRAIAVDLLGRSQPEELPADCAAWLTTTVEDAVARICESSLSALVEALDSRLEVAPRAIARRLDEAEVRHDAGCT